MKNSITTTKQTNGLTTKRDLKELEKRMDHKYASKGDIIELEDRLINRMHRKFALREDLISFKDAILHEIKGLREEISIVIGYKDQIEDHETRLETVEKRLSIPQ